MFKAKGIHKSYGDLKVLKGVDITIQRGEIVSLVGTSGAGKSTLLQVLGLLDRPDQGEVWFDETLLSSLSDRGQARFRNENIGFVFQFHHLLPEFTALENVCMPAFIAGKNRKLSEDRAKSLLEELNLGDRGHHKPSQLSGGEQQRVAVARALMNKPQLILADEPTGNLDSGNSVNLFNLLFKLAREFEVAFLIATHSESLAMRADYILKIKDGIIE
ncbi:MAG: ABC transporter ATP-binding protein [Bacteroidia bacterium]|nr:ABC transporter ATP-binding protein [Bacteroidia bacterium]